MIAAVGRGQLRLPVRAHGADHGRAEVLRPLTRDEPDAAGRGVDQDGVARLHLIGAVQQVVGSHALEHHGRGGLVGDVVGQGDQTVGRYQPGLGIGADRRCRIGDAVAGLDLADAFAHRLDDAGALHADHRGQPGERVEAAAVVGVDVVEAHGGLAHQRLAGARGADLDILPDQDLRASGLMDLDRFGYRCLRAESSGQMGL